MTQTASAPTLDAFAHALANVHKITQETPLESSRFLADVLGLPEV
mgnify:FL=1